MEQRQRYEHDFFRAVLSGLPLLSLRRGFVIEGVRLLPGTDSTTAEVTLVSRALGRAYLLRRTIWPHDPTIDAVFASATFTTVVEEWTGAHDSVFPDSTVEQPAVVWK